MNAGKAARDVPAIQRCSKLYVLEARLKRIRETEMHRDRKRERVREEGADTDGAVTAQRLSSFSIIVERGI